MSGTAQGRDAQLCSLTQDEIRWIGGSRWGERASKVYSATAYCRKLLAKNTFLKAIDGKPIEQETADRIREAIRKVRDYEDRELSMVVR